ncbi:hypothetical protein PRUPE_3G136800 [Prunus persica]|uniref:F-box domain-containing protein n=1 Tax=Prunus persica TaxID=3760 RepID=A0A251PZY7_PRUPE|nr:FBD-associated F-box protein At4g10400 isoform X2 [Prunus persica]ONI17078.1 hypothetical protein PRUPE_3G136800 [Prunus persica]
MDSKWLWKKKSSEKSSGESDSSGSVSSHSERYSDEQFVQVIGSIARRTASTQEEQHNIPIKGDITYLLQDQISPLPDEILIGILSRLNTREASRTSAISKRWRNLWTHVTCLNFDEDVVQNKRFDQFEISARAKWVTQVLQLHQGSTLDMFRMNRHYSTSVPATKCIEFAARKRVQRLEIEGGHNSLLKKLLESPFKSLRHLSLKNIAVNDELVGHFLSHCEVLEHLCVCCIENLYAVKAVGSSLRLKFLQVSNCRQLVRVDIFAPNLVEFVYDSRSVYTRGIVLKHAPSLVKVSLAENDESITRAFLSVSSCFSCLHTLSLRMNFDLQINMPQEFPELTCLKDLSLEVCNANCGQSLLSLTPLLERSPSLHRLTLQMRWKWNYYKKQSWRDMQKINRCPHHCLKEVKFCGFLGFGSIIDTDFAMYLIECAMVLEKLIVELETRREILPEFKATDNMLEATREHVLQLGTQLPPRAELIII